MPVRYEQRDGDVARGPWRVIDRGSVAFALLGGLLVVAGGLVAAVNSAAPFAHGSWLAAYLVLVGGVSQLLLGLGRLALPGAGSSPRTRCAQAALWNAGSLAVAAGVLMDLAPLVTVGSVVLLAALGCFAAGAHVRPVGRHGRVIADHVMVLALASSVIVGSALADAIPGG